MEREKPFSLFTIYYSLFIIHSSTQARQHLAAHVLTIFFSFIGFKGLKEGVGCLGHVTQLPCFAPGMRRAREPESVNACFLRRSVPEKFAAGGL